MILIRAPATEPVTLFSGLSIEQAAPIMDFLESADRTGYPKETNSSILSRRVKLCFTDFPKPNPKSRMMKQ